MCHEAGLKQAAAVLENGLSTELEAEAEGNGEEDENLPAGDDDEFMPWMLSKLIPLAEREAEPPAHGNCVFLDDASAFIRPTIIGFPNYHDFTQFGYNIGHSGELMAKHAYGEMENGDAQDSEDFAYSSITCYKGMADSKLVPLDEQKAILDTVLFGAWACSSCFRCQTFSAVGAC